MEDENHTSKHCTTLIITHTKKCNAGNSTDHSNTGDTIANKSSNSVMQVVHWKACIGEHALEKSCDMALLCCTDASVKVTSLRKLANANPSKQTSARLRKFILSLADIRASVHAGKRVKSLTSGKRG